MTNNQQDPGDQMTETLKGFKRNTICFNYNKKRKERMFKIIKKR